MWGPSDADPQPIRGSLGATILGPTDSDTTKNNPDLLAAPTTDHGSTYIFHGVLVEDRANNTFDTVEMLSGDSV